jgi:hypothetical protein
MAFVMAFFMPAAMAGFHAGMSEQDLTLEVERALAACHSTNAQKLSPDWKNRDIELPLDCMSLDEVASEALGAGIGVDELALALLNNPVTPDEATAALVGAGVSKGKAAAAVAAAQQTIAGRLKPLDYPVDPTPTTFINTGGGVSPN